MEGNGRISQEVEHPHSLMLRIKSAIAWAYNHQMPMLQRILFRSIVLAVTVCGGTMVSAQELKPNWLQGSTSVVDMPSLRGSLTSAGIRTSSLSTGLGKHHFGIGTARTGSLDALVGNATSDQLFGGTSKLTGRTRDLLLRTFAQMTCIEYNELSANYYTAAQNYRPLSLDRTLSLPGFGGGHVQCFSDGKHIIAIDPRSLDTWVTYAGAGVGDRNNWRKLDHLKN